MPQSVMEAMASGRPAVVSDLPDARDWLADLTPELLVPVGDSQATAAALQAALAQPPATKLELGTRLRQRVVDRADAETALDQVEAMYRELVRNASR